jgi:hypothetical protein
MINPFNYYCESNLVFEVMNTFVEKLSNELSIESQIEFNKINWIQLLNHEEYDQNDSEFVNDLEQLKPILERYLEEFGLNCLNLFSIHEIENNATNLMKFSTNALSEQEQLLLCVLIAERFEAEPGSDEKMPKDLNFDDYIDEISSELEKKHMIGTYSHYRNDNEYFEFYFKIELQTIILNIDLSQINTFDSTKIDHEKLDDYIRDLFNQNFSYIDLDIFYRSNALDTFEFENESNYESDEIDRVIELIDFSKDIYK